MLWMLEQDGQIIQVVRLHQFKQACSQFGELSTRNLTTSR